VLKLRRLFILYNSLYKDNMAKTPDTYTAPTLISEVVEKPEHAHACFTLTTIFEALMGDPKIIAKLLRMAVKTLEGFESSDNDGVSFEEAYRGISVNAKAEINKGGDKDLGLYIINQIAAIVRRALPLQKGGFTLDLSTVNKFCDLAGKQASHENPVEDLERECHDESIKQLRVDMFHELDRGLATKALYYQVGIVNVYLGELVKTIYKPDIDLFIDLLSKLSHPRDIELLIEANASSLQILDPAALKTLVTAASALHNAKTFMQYLGKLLDVSGIDLAATQ